MSRRFDLLLESPFSSVATFGDTVITVVHTQMTAEALNAATAASKRLAAIHPAGVSGLAIVKRGALLPNAELRRAASQTMLATEAHTRCTARVFLGDGFWLSTMRSVLTAIELIQPYNQVKRTFADVRLATRWMALTTSHDTAWAEHLCDAALEMARISGQDVAHAP